jgi:hypothetical protein
MDRSKKILLVVGLLSFAVGGFILVKYLTRNVVRYKYITVKYVDYPTAEVTTTEGDN